MQAQEDRPDGDDAGSAPHALKYSPSLRNVVKQYLSDVPEYQHLCSLRKQGWETREADQHFKIQRHKADTADAKTTRHFYGMMQSIAREMDRETGVLKLTSRGIAEQCSRVILDMCMAPGGFLATALTLNPRAKAVAFSLPQSEGGHPILLFEYENQYGSGNGNVTTHLLDVTMLAADMGIPPEEIPPTHPDANNFLPRYIHPGQRFDLAFCDGQVLRTQARPAHRDKGNPIRLTLSQLIISLSHLKPGGRMVVLLHKLESPDVVSLLYAFTRFASVQLFKPRKWHATRSSFYMVATNVKSDSDEAKRLVEKWRRIWKLVTFEVEMEDAWFDAEVHKDSPDVADLMGKFGPRYIEMGRSIWETQANALEKAPWMKKADTVV